MRIGIDARLLDSERTGIASYTAHLVQSLAGLEGGEEFVLFTDRAVSLPGPNFSNAVIPTKRRVLWSFLRLPFRLRREGIDLYHGTANFEMPPAARCRLVCTVHDLIPLALPEMVSRKYHLLFRGLIGHAVRRADRVITVSEFSRREILRRFRVAPEKVSVIPEAPRPAGPAPLPGEGERVRRKYGLAGPYLLFVGAFEPRKNIPFLVESFLRFRRDHHGGEYQLALAGGAGYGGAAIAGEIRGRGLEPAVRLLGYVPEEDLPALYRESALLVFPSLYEGFGLPLLEAMGYGTPVLAADATSLPEIVGDAGELFPPGDPSLLAERIGSLVSSPEKLADLSRRGLERAGRYSWRETARRTLAVYRELLGSGGDAS